MGKNLLILSFFFVLFASTPVAFAETEITDTTATIAQATSVTPTKSIKTTRMEAKDAMKDKMTEAKDAMKSKMIEARETYKEKIREIKDARKAKIVENFDNRINERNKKRTSHMSRHLEKLTLILGKISTKAATLKVEGKDTVTLEADIAAATIAISNAKAAIDLQAAKDYIVVITTDATLKGAASATVLQFITDIKGVKQEVLDAQSAVRKAHKELAKLTGGTTVSITPTITSTP